MARQIFTLAALKKIDFGVVTEHFDRRVAQLAADCMDRPHVKTAREVHLIMRMVPVPEVRGTTILLSVLGLAVAVYTVATINRDRPPEPPPAAPPSVNPFERGIAGTGIVEAATRNIAVGAPEAGLVARVLVQVGELVRQGQPLLEMDARLLEAEHVRASSAVATAEARS